jgi:hypothetical protein
MKPAAIRWIGCVAGAISVCAIKLASMLHLATVRWSWLAGLPANWSFANRVCPGSPDAMTGTPPPAPARLGGAGFIGEE